MDLTVVVVSWNTRALVLACVANVLAELAAARKFAGLEADVRVVDNGSTDGTADAVRAAFPTVEVIALPENLGFAAGCNRGLRGLRARHALLLNSDAAPGAGGIARCVAFLDANPGVAIVGPQLLHPDGRRQNSVHNSPRLATEILPVAVFQWLAPGRFPSKRSIGDRPVEVEAVTGAAVFAKARAIREVGPLPEEYFFYLEETEWCRRVRKAGWRVAHLPTALVVHISGASSKRKDPASARIEYHRSLYRFFRASRGASAAATVVAIRLLKCLFYLVTQAPLALAGARARERWQVHRDVLAWHLRGCPDAGGLAGFRTAGRPPGRMLQSG